MIGRRRRTAWLAGTLTAVMLTAASAPAVPAVGRIAFTGVHGEVFTVRPDGTGLRQVTTGPAWQYAVWAPHGNRLAVLRQRYDPATGREFSSVAVMHPDGSGSIRITRRVIGSVQHLVWAPGGGAVAFTDYDTRNDALPSPYPGAIVVARADGSGQRRLTGYAGWNVEPTWSPDGRRLAFVSSRDGDGEIFVMRRDGSRLRKLTDNDTGESRPLWSPDGSTIAFATSSLHTTARVGVMNADGTQIRMLTGDGEDHRLESWSPDGRRLLLARRTQTSPDAPSSVTLRVVEVDTGRVSDIVTRSGFGGAAWSPDGRRIVFSDGARVFVVPATGGAPTRISRGSLPTWQPATQ